MDLTPYVDNLRRELVTAAAAGGDQARALAERLTAPLEPAVRLTLLSALSTAMGEITRELAPGSVDVRLRGLDPEFVVTPPAAEPYAAPAAPRTAPAAPAPETEDGSTARINFRLPAHLKTRVEDTATREGLSVNAWLVKAVATALEPAAPACPARTRSGQSHTGWAR